MIFVGVLLLAIGMVFLAAGLTGRPRSVIGMEAVAGDTADKTPGDVPQGLPETPAQNPPELPSPPIPTSRRVSTILLGILGVFFGIISILGN